MLLDLLNAYWENAGPFLVLHAIFFVYTTEELWRFWRWEPRPDEEAWQRLETRAQHLRGIIGLLLLIGIAGTFFGLFHLSSERDPAKFPDVLQQALRKAFPIGFVGLALTLGFNFLADLVERRKGEHLETLRHDTSRSLESMVKSLRAIQEGVQGLPSAVTSALEPIRNLDETLQSALKPTVETLVRVLEEQGRQLTLGKDALVQAATDVRAATQEATGSIKRVAGATENAIKALEAAEGLEIESKQVLQALRRAVSDSSQLITKTTRQLGRTGQTVAEVEAKVATLPERIAQQAAEAAAAGLEAILARMDSVLDQQLQQSSQRLDSYSSEMKTRIGGLVEALKKATEEVVRESTSERHEWDARFLEQRSGLSSSLKRIQDTGAEVHNTLNAWADQLVAEMQRVERERREGYDANLFQAEKVVAALVESLKAETLEARKMLTALEAVAPAGSAIGGDGSVAFQSTGSPQIPSDVLGSSSQESKENASLARLSDTGLITRGGSQLPFTMDPPVGQPQEHPSIVEPPQVAAARDVPPPLLPLGPSPPVSRPEPTSAGVPGRPAAAIRVFTGKQGDPRKPPPRPIRNKRKSFLARLLDMLLRREV